MSQKREQYPLYYITHIDNLPSILERGILSHNAIQAAALPYQRIDHESVNNLRASRKTPDGRSLWDYANLYFQPRNAMLYQVFFDPRKNSKARDSIVVLKIDPDILNDTDIWIADGKAARRETQILNRSEGLQAIRRIKHILDQEFWNEADGSKRRMMAECLVPERVNPQYIREIYVPNAKTRQRVAELIQPSAIPIIPDAYLFFLPKHTIEITPKLHLVKGDMFFSFAQTLTISVNTQGVMGKGLAARAKHQFPDVYVVYQDVCKQKQLQPGRPYLYRRESSLDLELAEDQRFIQEPNTNKWFLLFPTKRKWREHSNLDDIRQGLVWIQTNYEQEGITSLALPALGCGLGGLAWADVGPLLCKSMADLRIPVRIYLPRETDTQIPDEQFTRAFLLGR